MANDRKPTPPAGTPRPAYDPDLIRQFLETQSKEIDVKRDQIALQKQDIANTHEFAQQQLKAQVQDRERIREHEQKTRRDRMWFAAFVFVGIGAFIVYALQIGKDQFAADALKTLTTLLIGGIGGYAIRSQKKSGEKGPE